MGAARFTFLLSLSLVLLTTSKAIQLEGHRSAFEEGTAEFSLIHRHPKFIPPRRRLFGEEDNVIPNEFIIVLVQDNQSLREMSPDSDEIAASRRSDEMDWGEWVGNDVVKKLSQKFGLDLSAIAVKSSFGPKLAGLCLHFDSSFRSTTLLPTIMSDPRVAYAEHVCV